MKFSLPFLAAALVPLISLVTTQAAPLRDSLSGDVELVSRELSAREVPTDGFVDGAWSIGCSGLSEEWLNAIRPLCTSS